VCLSVGTKIQQQKSKRVGPARGSNQVQTERTAHIIKAQLLAEIFTFQNKKAEVYKSEDCVTQGTTPATQNRSMISPNKSNQKKSPMNHKLKK
jgi:transposase